jgi:hypothetical protein
MTKFASKKLIGAWAIAFFIGLYRTFVSLNLWNWFAVPYLHLPNLSFLQLWGLMLLASAVMPGNFHAGESDEKMRWATLGEAVQMCIPDDKQHTWKEYWDGEPARVFFCTVGGILGAFASNTLVLVMGFLLHIATI